MGSIKSHHYLLLAVAAALAIALGFWTGSVNKNEQEIHTAPSVLTVPDKLPEFTLTDHRLQAFNKDRLRGQWNLLFFGYTYCPDICPTTLYMLKLAMESYKAQGGDPSKWQVVFISVDPGRDNPEQLGNYVKYFNPEFIGATGSEAEIKKLADSLNIVYARVENPSSPENYLVDHSATIIAIDPDGKPARVFNPPHQPDEFGKDMLTLSASPQ
jgi:protein SCO1/2